MEIEFKIKTRVLITMCFSYYILNVTLYADPLTVYNATYVFTFYMMTHD